MSAVTVYVHHGHGEPTRLSGRAASVLVGDMHARPEVTIRHMPEFEREGLVEDDATEPGEVRTALSPLGWRVRELLQGEIS